MRTSTKTIGRDVAPASVKSVAVARAPLPEAVAGAGITSAAPGAPTTLHCSPEFLFRRAHQIATAAFAEACRDLDLTPSQYSALFMLREAASVSQNELGRMISLDRSTTSVVLRSLRERRLVRDSSDPEDRRKKRLRLTDTGRLLLAEAERLNAGTSRQLLSVLGGEKAALLLSLLQEFSSVRRMDATL